MKKYHPKKKPKRNFENREVIVEPTRRSIFDVLQANLKFAKRGGFIHRLLYVGEHNFDISTALENNHRLTNLRYHTEPFSGVLLHYARHFCYIVEGSEAALAIHLTLLLQQEDKNLGNVRLLAAVHHVKSRFTSEWTSYYGRPPERVEDLGADSNLETSMIYVYECCEKLYNFANALIADQKRAKEQTEDEEESEERRLQTRIRSRSLVERDVYSGFLPELKLLNFLINCTYLKTLKQYYQYFRYVGQSKDYSLKAWPGPKNFTPYDVFDETYDPITDLPENGPTIQDKEEEVSVMDRSESKSTMTTVDTVSLLK